MAVYTKIPASNVAGVMGKTLGKVAGGISQSATKSLNTLLTKLQNLIVNLDSETSASLAAKLAPIEAAMLVIEKAFNAVQKSLNAIKKLVKTLKIPIKALKIAINVIKIIPMPQAPLIVAITTVFSDLLEMLSELVAQIGEICDALLSIIDTLTALIDPILSMIEQLRQIIALLKARMSLYSDSLSDDDKQKLTNLGLLDSQGNNLLDSILQGTSGAGSDTNSDGTSTGGSGGKGTGAVSDANGNGGFYANYGNSGVDLNDTENKNRIALAPTGSSIILVTDTGDWKYKAFIQSDNQPNKPTSRNTLPPEGWVGEIPSGSISGSWWYSETTVSGKNGRAGVWSDPKLYDSSSILGLNRFGSGSLIVNDSSSNNYGSSNSNGDSNSSNSNIVSILGADDILGLDTSKNNELSGILKISSTDEANNLLLKLIDKVDKSSISLDLKNQIRSLLDVIPTVTTEEQENDSDYTYTGPDGTVYTLTIVIDPDSPSIAPRRYVSVSDPSGTVVLDGTKSFTDSNDVLISEMKVRLSQLLG